MKKYSTNKIIRDFYELYILEDRIKLSKLEGLTFESYPKYFENENIQKDLCFYITEKLINSLPDVYCDISNSAKGGEVFYRVWRQSWNKTSDKINFNIHIEAYGEKVYVHFETNPYIPYKKLDEKAKEIMNRQKEIFMQKIESLQEISGIEKRPIRANATLTIGNFKLRYDSFEDYYLILRNLLDKLNPIITKI